MGERVALLVAVVVLAAASAPATAAAASPPTAPVEPGLATVGSLDANVTGERTAGSARFVESVVRAERGDVLTIAVKTSRAATVNLGGSRLGFWLQFDVGEGTTRIELSTYRAGRTGYDLGEMVRVTKGSIGNLRLKTPRLTNPLEPHQYTMNVTMDGVDKALGTFVVERRHTNASAVRVAPEDTVDRVTSPDSVAKSLQRLDRAAVEPDGGAVAKGDVAVFRVNASGLDWFFRKGKFESDDGVSVEFVENASMNERPDRFGPDALVNDAENDVFYALVDTGQHDADPGDEFRAEFTVGEGNPLVDETESVNATFRMVERRVRLDRDGERIVVENETTIAGTATLSPGSTINVTAYDTGIDHVLRPRTVTVRSDGTFNATFDFGDLEPGRTFEIRLRDQGRSVPAVVGPIETTTAPPTTETPASNGTATTATPNATERLASTERPITARTVADGGLPGFDAGVALLALGIAALLALRRDA